VAGSSNEVAETEQPAVVVERAAWPASVRISLTGIFLIMLVAALHLARAIVLPLVLAMLLTFTVAPLVHRLARKGVPPVVSAVLLVAVLGSIAAGAATLLRDPISDMVREAPQIMSAVRERFAFVREPFERLSQATEGPATTVPATPATPAAPSATVGPTVTVVERQPSIFDWLVGTLADVGTTVVATLILTPFLIAYSDALKLKLIRLFPLLSDKKRTLRVLHDVEQRISRYLLTVTAIYAGVGLMVGTAMWVLGMPNPGLWGAGAMLLSYVPWVGPLTGVALAAAVSLTIHQDIATALVPPLVYFLIQSVVDTLVTPVTVGRRMSLNVVAVLLTIALTSWMWGIIGTLIGIPILVVVKAFCDEFPSLAHVGLFISAESEPIEENGNGEEAHAAPPVAAATAASPVVAARPVAASPPVAAAAKPAVAPAKPARLRARL
jgi:predicted PurR-regulated permease PerM